MQFLPGYYSTNLVLKKKISHPLSELKASLRDLEHKNADLTFLNNQYVHKAKQLERESRDKSETILQLQEKNFHAVVHTPGESGV